MKEILHILIRHHKKYSPDTICRQKENRASGLYNLPGEEGYTGRVKQNLKL